MSANVHAYLVFRKRGHTTNVRFRDFVGIVLADRKRPPFARGAGLGMRNVDWWAELPHHANLGRVLAGLKARPGD